MKSSAGHVTPSFLKFCISKNSPLPAPSAQCCLPVFAPLLDGPDSALSQVCISKRTIALLVIVWINQKSEKMTKSFWIEDIQSGRVKTVIPRVHPIVLSFSHFLF